MRIKEIKRHVDGRVEEFICELVELGENHAIIDLAFSRDEPLEDGPFKLPAGALHTRAYFWTDRHYLIYEISHENGPLLGYRFDVCDNVRITSQKISFDDLELDLWVDAHGGSIHVLDEADVQEHAQNGLITRQQLELIERTKSFLVDNHQQVIRSLKR